MNNRNQEIILNVSQLKTYFTERSGWIFSGNNKKVNKAVNGVDLIVKKNEIHGLIGESGSGKSITALSLLRLVPNNGKIVSGEIKWKSKDILKVSDKEIRNIRGKEISIIFQNPQGALNPLCSIGKQISAVLKRHYHDKTVNNTKKKALNLLEYVRFKEPEEIYDKYPNQLSGGMCQRAMIALAIACNPTLLIADEPTSSLDVTIQQDILKLLWDLHIEKSMTILWISHDMTLVKSFCDRISVMYNGKIVERGNKIDIFSGSKHPYTTDLIEAAKEDSFSNFLLQSHKGRYTGNGTKNEGGCSYYYRCKKRMEKCKKIEPKLYSISSDTEDDWLVACLHHRGK